MAEPNQLISAADTPIYTIKTVVQQTGITPATLRAWERRYGVLSPGRSDGGYRLYSERDIAILRWLKAQVEAGIAISSAVTLLDLQHRAGEQPEQDILSASPAGREPAAGPRNAPAVIEELLGALLAFREGEAEAILAEAFALYPVESVAEDIIAPVLVEIGERWHRGEASVVQEHFATAFLRRRLSTLFHAYDQPAAGPLAITGSAPGEWHDVGILLVSLTLRQAWLAGDLSGPECAGLAPAPRGQVACPRSGLFFRDNGRQRRRAPGAVPCHRRPARSQAAPGTRRSDPEHP